MFRGSVFRYLVGWYLIRFAKPVPTRIIKSSNNGVKVANKTVNTNYLLFSRLNDKTNEKLFILSRRLYDRLTSHRNDINTGKVTCALAENSVII